MMRPDYPQRASLRGCNNQILKHTLRHKLMNTMLRKYHNAQYSSTLLSTTITTTRSAIFFLTRGLVMGKILKLISTTRVTPDSIITVVTSKHILSDSL